MTMIIDPERDLTIERVIRAPRAAVWQAWADPVAFAQWWIPAPMLCKVVAMEMKPGGAFITQMSDDGTTYVPHLDACFLDASEGERITFTTALTAGWRPVEKAFIIITATMRFEEVDGGTRYSAHVMHRSNADRATHDTLGFYEGWGTAIAQLAAIVEPRG